MSDAQHDPIDAIAASFLERLRGGERPTIDEFAEQYPQHEADIRQLFPVLLAMEQAAGSPDGSVSSGWSEARIPDRLGEYRIVREIGRGGMGLVYEAVHEKLGRRVALKVLPRTLNMDIDGLDRFRREVRAAAQLQHRNIVPVFEAGEDQGVHFYAMQFVEGDSLDRVLDHLRSANRTIRDDRRSAEAVKSQSEGRVPGSVPTEPLPSTGALPPGLGPGSKSASSAVLPGGCRVDSSSAADSSYWKAVARIGIQVAGALHHAHANQIVHRDVKPSNIVLDHEGTAWVTDFGLAKLDGPDLTRTGSVLGTLRYVSPEQLRGWADPRSDVYGLGLTLYELLTLRSAFSTSDRVELTREIAEEEPPAPRKLVPAVPRDLETIVLKAIDKEPGRRYQSADELAEDLRRFLAVKPILARRVSGIGRMVRWSRRNPLLAASFGAVAALLLFVAVGATVVAAKMAVLAGTIASEKDRANAQLFQSYVSEAKARRWSRRPGQRFVALEAISGAVGLLDSVEHDESEVRDLRNQAIATQAMADVRLVRPFELQLNHQPGFDSRLELIAQSDNRGEIQVCRVDDGSVQKVLPPQGSSAYRILFSPDDRYLAAAHAPNASDLSEAVAKVWDLNSREAIIEDELNGWAMTFSADGGKFAVRDRDGRVAVYDLKKRSLDRELSIDRARSGVAFQPNGNLLATFDRESNNVFFCDLGSGEVERVWTVSQGLRCLDWSPDGRFLAAGCRNSETLVWNVERRKNHATLRGHEGTVGIVQFSPDGNLLATSADDGKLILWDPAGGYERLRLDAGWCCRFSSDGRRIAARDYRTAYIYEVAPGLEYRQLAGHGGDVHGVSVSPDGRLLASAASDGVRLWDAASLREVGRLPVGETKTVLFAAQGESLITAGAGGLRRWPVEPDPSKNIVRVGPPTLLGTSSIRPRDLVASASVQRTALAYVASTKEVRVLSPAPSDAEPLSLSRERGDFEWVAMSPDGRYAATAGRGDTGVDVFDGSTGEHLRHLPHQGGYVEVHFAPDGRWLVTNVRREYRFWEVGTWELRHHLARKVGVEGPVAWTGDGGTVALLSSRELVNLHDARSFELLASLECPHPHPIVSLSFTPDGSRLFAAAANLVQCWDLRGIRTELRRLDLDWDSPPPPVGYDRDTRPLQVELVSEP